MATYNNIKKTFSLWRLKANSETLASFLLRVYSTTTVSVAVEKMQSVTLLEYTIIQKINNYFYILRFLQ